MDVHNSWGTSVLGLRLIGNDEQLQAAIRLQLERARTPAPKAGGGHAARRSRRVVDDLRGERRKLLRLYYDAKIGPDLFAEEEARLSVAIGETQRETDAALAETVRNDEVDRHFDDVAAVLASLDIDKTWRVATDLERRVLIDEFIEEISGITRLRRRESARSAAAAHPVPGGWHEGVGFRSCQRGVWLT